jgi:hypothetical protein
VVVSTVGKIGGKLTTLRPEVSQFQVWFDKKRYFSETRISVEDRKMKVRLNSPEKQWNGNQSFKFPNPKGLYCYFGQIMECAHVTGFVQKAIAADAGKMNLYIVWEGYPFSGEQYLNIQDNLFEKAVLEYDGKNKNGERRFSLRLTSNTIFYFINERNEMTKMFWPSQGISMVASDQI